MMIPGRLLPLAALLLGAAPAFATTLDCSTVQGVVHTAPAYVTVNLQQGETLNISTPDGGTLAVSIEFGGQGGKDDSICNPAFDGTSCDGFSHQAQLTGDYGVEAFAQAGNTFTLSCGGGGGGAAATGVQGAQGTGAFVSASSSIGFVGSAINGSLAGAAPATVTRNGLFLSTLGADSGVTGWAALQGRQFDGDVDGSARELTFGMDFEAGAATRLGLFVSIGKSDLDISGVSVDSDAISFGPYFKTQLGDRYSVTGYALFARPDYDVGGITYRAERRAAGLTANADYTWGSADIRSFIGLSGFAEDHPAAGGLSARRISGLTGSIGTRASFDIGTSLTPYVSLGAEYNRYDDGLGTREDHTGPRIGTGFAYDAGKGRLTLDVDGGRLLDDTRDLKLRMNYNLNF
ncbi:autotransporter outer membrane beta-barrel domain-containing protein [Mameliella alba]|nr:autotransporter outer membrane beta-barrel domain-containing protein [Mameliella alba]MBY6168330.1 autotransporter outer membrane beta-barrel domain-containing protein [Mameliella alba]MBY6173351.1 autotransporter outer membrane beta-barrel domain-containing protein [Mameliella alba]